MEAQKCKTYPRYKEKLISVGQLNSEGHVTAFVGSSWKITKDAMVIA